MSARRIAHLERMSAWRLRPLRVMAVCLVGLSAHLTLRLSFVAGHQRQERHHQLSARTRRGPRWSESTKVRRHSEGEEGSSNPELQGQDAALVQELQALADKGMLPEMEDLIYDQIDDGEELPAQVYNLVIQACVDDMERAERWLFRMRALDVEPTSETYVHLMSAARQSEGGFAAAERWFNQAIDGGMTPDAKMYTEVLRAIENDGETLKVEVWVEQMMLAGFTPDISDVNLVISTFAQRGRLPKVREWMAIAEKSLGLSLDADTFAIAMESFASEGLPEQAEALFEEMKQRNIQPNAACYIALLSDRKAPRHHQAVRRWTDALLESGIEIDEKSFIAMMGALGAVGDHTGVDECFQRMSKEGKVTAEALAMDVEALVLGQGAQGQAAAQERIQRWEEDGNEVTPAIPSALAAKDVLNGKFEQVESRMQKMEMRGVEMDEDSVTCLLLAYANTDPPQSELAEQLFKQHILLGKIKATRPLLEALKYAVGGARCLSLRRELQLADQSLAGPTAVVTATDNMVMGQSYRKRNPRNSRRESSRPLKWA